jgi:HlyD family type I secretion membrane fusion protein
MSMLPAIRETALRTATPVWSGFTSTHAACRTMGIERVVTTGVIVIVLFFFGFIGWAATAPLDSAAIAPATIVVESSRKAIQHFDGGTVSKVLVHEGDQVVAGQPLVIMDDTTAKATVDMLQGDLDASLALQARLIAERDKRDHITFPDELVNRSDKPKVAEVMAGQQRTFVARREAIESQTNILLQRNAQTDEEIKGLQGQIKAENQQLAFIKEEQTGVEALLKKGLETKPHLLALQRQAADIQGTRAQNEAAIARAHQSAGENNLKIVDLTVSIVNDSAQKLHDEEVKISDAREKLRSAQEVLDRTVLRAPVSGKIVNLKLFTPGGVVPPKDTVMEIVPDNDRLIVEAQVSPNDIDVVHNDLPVQLKFPAFNQRTMPTVYGHVDTVSADRQTDQHSGKSYYTARIVIDRGVDKLKNFKLYPGMPAEAMIVTGERTLMSYLMKPLFSGISNGMRED